MEYYRNYVRDLAQSMQDLEVTDAKGASLDIAFAFSQWMSMTQLVYQKSKQVFFIGNGASCAIANHLSADSTKQGKLKGRTFSEASLLTAIGNDMSFDEVFSLPLKSYAAEGDLLITISSSGNSPNIVKALSVAQELKLHTITLSGLGPENKSRRLGQLNFYIPGKSYGIVESAHQALLHCWLDKWCLQFN